MRARPSSGRAIVSPAPPASGWTRERLCGPTREWLSALPPTPAEDGRLGVHGSPGDPMWEYGTNSPGRRGNFATLAEGPVALGFHGHTHVPIAFRDDDGRIEV